MLADVFTPVGIYLRLRDRFRDTILMESTDFHTMENSYSIIGINAIAGIEITAADKLEYKLPGQTVEKISIAESSSVPGLLNDFLKKFNCENKVPVPVNIAQGLFGYSSYDSVQFFESVEPVQEKTGETAAIPLMRYRLYQYVIIFDHFKDELFICENTVGGIPFEIGLVESLIRSRDVPEFPFSSQGEVSSNKSDVEYLEMVKKGIAHCRMGDVFQLVLSRRFEQKFTGDEFNVYRALRSINPSPYLFYFDYGDYRLMGSSPESQLIVKNNKVIVHPIAGTVKRTGDDEEDRLLAGKLKSDPKENAEHVMLVDLARNDLSRISDKVEVTQFRETYYYSHVIHLVSEVSGTLTPGYNPFQLLASTYPAGTLSGAPKFRAMQLISEIERDCRGYYGGAIGYFGFDGSVNKAIMIRTFLSRNNTLVFQAGAGIVAASDPESELQEVNHKLQALKLAIQMAQQS